MNPAIEAFRALTAAATHTARTARAHDAAVAACISDIPAEVAEEIEAAIQLQDQIDALRMEGF